MQQEQGPRHFFSFTNNEIPSDFAWFADNSDGHPHAVGGKKPNAFGLNDMHGNVAEWVLDCASNDYSSKPADGSPWLKDGCRRRVQRGGAYLHRIRMLRSAQRDFLADDQKNNYAGFRIAREFGDTKSSNSN